jgi:enoyl-CoA hydratase/carnithine racemase
VELKTLRYEVAEGVALVTLDRPERHNAWTGRMEHEYRWAMAQADADAAVRAVVVTGAGRDFCVGADARALDAIAGSGAYDRGVDEAQLPRPGAGVSPDFEHQLTFHLGMATPVVAAVNGAAAGLGFVLACFADVRFAADDARFTTSFAKLGLPAEAGISWLLPRLVGVARAADLLLSSRVVGAAEAHAMGLVNRVVPAAELVPAALAYARAMARETSPSSLRTIKRQLYADVSRSLDEAAQVASRALDRMAGEPDFGEAVAAWRERRPPRFGPDQGH